VGGTGAMLGLAKNQLSSTDYSQLAKSVPGIDSCRAVANWRARRFARCKRQGGRAG
jgi:hypothetical protein